MKDKLSNRLRLLREERDITQKKLGEILNTSDATINRYEKGIRNPDPSTIAFLATFFDVSADYLLGQTEDRTINTKPNKSSPEIRKISRAAEKMSPEQREQWLNIAKVIAPEAFKDKRDEQDTN